MENIGKYSIEKVIGSGATSKVYLAFDPFSNQYVALKLIDLSLVGDERHLRSLNKQLQIEASLVGKLTHPHIVKMLDAVTNDNQTYIVMEYVSGGTLKQYSETGQLLPFTKVAELMYKCCRALEYADAHGVIHRDVKPSNILLQGENDVKISDFGAAMIADGQSTMILGIGSLSYMSPEQITGEILTRQSDIYSLGITMYKLLTGKFPYQATSREGMIFQIVSGELDSAKFHRPQIPEALDLIFQRATRKDLTQRYQDWGEFAHDLANFLNETDTESDVTTDAEKFHTLREISFFQKFSDAELWEVLKLSKWRKVSHASTILREGTIGDSMYILADGVVKVLRNGKIVGFMYKGDCFGEIKRLPNSTYRRTTGIEAGTDCTLLEVELDKLEQASLECRFQFDQSFLYILLRRVDSANTRISKLLGESEHY